MCQGREREGDAQKLAAAFEGCAIKMDGCFSGRSHGWRISDLFYVIPGIFFYGFHVSISIYPYYTYCLPTPDASRGSTHIVIHFAVKIEEIQIKS